MTVIFFYVIVKKMSNKIKTSILFFLIVFSVFSQELEEIKEQAQLYQKKGYLLQSQGNLKEALVYYQKAVQLDPSFYQVYNDIGVILEALGDVEGAIRMYKKAIEINPNYPPPYTNLALIYEEKKDIEKATFYWKKRYLLGDKKDYWWYKAIEHLVKLGTYPEARREYLKIKMQPFYSEMVEKRMKLLEEARLHLKKAEEYFENKNYKEAKKEFMKILELNPPDEDLQLKAKRTLKEIIEEERIEKLKDQVRMYIREASEFLEKGEYSLTAEKLKEALAVIFSIQK